MLADGQRGDERVEPKLAADIATEADLPGYPSLGSPRDPIQIYLLAKNLHFTVQIGVPRKAARRTLR